MNISSKLSKMLRRGNSAKISAVQGNVVVHIFYGVDGGMCLSKKVKGKLLDGFNAAKGLDVHRYLVASCQ